MTSLSKRLFSLNLALLLTALLAVPAAARDTVTAEELRTEVPFGAEAARESHPRSADHQDPNGEIPSPEPEFEAEAEFEAEPDFEEDGESPLTEDEAVLPEDETAPTEDEAVLPEDETAPTEDEAALTEDEAVLPEDETAPTEDEAALMETEDGEASLLAETPYVILEDGDSGFFTNRDASGTGWEYSAASNELTLYENYGGSISAYGGLTIVVSGNVTVSAPDGSEGGYNAIHHELPDDLTPSYDDRLFIDVPAGSSLTVNGGAGNYGGGSAVYSNYAVTFRGSGSVTLTGGDSTYAGYYDENDNRKNCYAGDGVFAGDIALYGSNVSAYGGDILSTSTLGGYAGCGLYAIDSAYLSGGGHVLRGGEGAYRAGDGVSAISVRTFADNSSFLGGDSDTTGGHGVYTSTARLYGDGTAYTGGDSANRAGCGVYADDVTVSGHCTIRGGYGTILSAPAIYYFDTCSFGAYNITLCNGGSDIALQCSSDADDFTYSQHTDLDTEGTYYHTIRFTIKDYRLRLYGNSKSGYGYYNGSATFSSLKPYRTTYDLTDYRFESTRYTQVGWGGYSTSGKSILPLTASITPTSHTSLYAIWTSVTPQNLIVLNGLEGLVKSTARYTTSIGKDVKLPASLIYEDSRDLLAWSSEVAPESDESGTLSGVWYEGGDTVSPNPYRATLLYGQSDIGTYAIYHPNGGSFTNGGTILVQGTRSTYSDLTVYAPAAGVITAPEGSMLAGWASSPSAASPTYEAGDSVRVACESVKHLYAIWKPEEFSTEVNGLTVTHCPATKTVTVNITGDRNTDADLLIAALYGGDGAMQTCARCSLTAASTLKLTYSGPAPTLKLFLPDSDLRPTAAHETIPLSTLS